MCVVPPSEKFCNTTEQKQKQPAIKFHIQALVLPFFDRLGTARVYVFTCINYGQSFSLSEYPSCSSLALTMIMKMMIPFSIILLHCGLIYISVKCQWWFERPT